MTCHCRIFGVCAADQSVGARIVRDHCDGNPHQDAERQIAKEHTQRNFATDIPHPLVLALRLAAGRHPGNVGAAAIMAGLVRQIWRALCHYPAITRFSAATTLPSTPSLFRSVAGTM